MLNKVVSTLQRSARDRGLSTLRFNYRGVGQSEGRPDMDQGEVDDAEAAAAWLVEQASNQPLTLMGFSFGGFVAAAVGRRLEQKGVKLGKLIMVAPAVQRLTANAPPAETCPLLIIQPEDDEIIAPEQVYEWSDRLGRPHELLKVAECSHFFHGRLTELKELLQSRL